MPKKNIRHMVGISNHGRSVRFVLVVDASSKTYSITTLKPTMLSMMVLSKECKKVEMVYEIFDSMDDLHEGISQLAKNYKESETDHVHCWKGGKEHIHKVDDLGIKLGDCPPKRKK